MRIIIECPENILHLEAGYIYADCLFAQLQPSCSPAADHTFSTVSRSRWLGSVKWANARCAATWRMGHHHRCHSLLAIAVHRLVLNCELAGAAGTQTKAFQLVAVASR